MIWADGFNLRPIFIVFSLATFVAVGFNLQVYISILQAHRAAGLGA